MPSRLAANAAQNRLNGPLCSVLSALKMTVFQSPADIPTPFGKSLKETVPTSRKREQIYSAELLKSMSPSQISSGSYTNGFRQRFTPNCQKSGKGRRTAQYFFTPFPQPVRDGLPMLSQQRMPKIFSSLGRFPQTFESSRFFAWSLRHKGRQLHLHGMGTRFP